jgi:CRP-like cAMP-binding protein
MPSSAQPLCEPRNRLLALLAAAEYESLQDHLELVETPHKFLAMERDMPIKHVYFPCTVVFSILVTKEDGSAVEVATIGNEGAVAIDAFVGRELAHDNVVCQVPGQSMRMPLSSFEKAIDGDTPLRMILQRYLQAYLGMVSQSVACNGLHTLDERFARWLLMTADRTQRHDFQLTQEFLAIMLGVHRPSVSLVANAFQQAGVIEYNRGHMRVLNRPALEKTACECYAMVNKHFERAFGPYRE